MNSTTGANVTQPGDSNLLTATTDGQGVFAIRLGPMVFPNSATQPYLLGLDPSSFTGTVNGSQVTRLSDPLIDGYTEQSTSGSDVYVSLYDMSNPSKPVLIGGYNPASQATATAAINILTGTVTSINVTNDGFNYTTSPTVVLTGGGFTSAATATAVMGTGANADKVVSITFTGGAGYTYAPTVSIALPPPSGNVTTNANGFFSIPINAGYFTTDGIKTIGIRATDAAGETGNMQLLNFVLDSQAPTAPAPTLDPVSDTGTFNNDNITNDNNAPVPPGNSYDAVSNFSLLSNPTPNGVWSYLYEQPAGSAPIQMTQANSGAECLDKWADTTQSGDHREKHHEQHNHERNPGYSDKSTAHGYRRATPPSRNGRPRVPGSSRSQAVFKASTPVKAATRSRSWRMGVRCCWGRPRSALSDRS